MEVSPEFLLAQFQALSSNNIEEANAANQQIMGIFNSDPANCLDSAAQIANTDGLTVTIYTRALMLIKSVLKPTSQKNYREISRFWMSFPEAKRTEIKQSVYRCLMINNTMLQDNAAATIAVISNVEKTIPDSSQYFSLLGDIFSKPEEYGEESKYGVLAAMGQILLVDNHSFISIGNDHYQNDLSIVIQITASVLQSSDFDINIRKKAAELLLICAKGYEERGIDIFEDDEVAEQFIHMVIENFSIDEESYHEQLYDILYILFKSKYVEIEDMFESIFNGISSDFQTSNLNIFRKCVSFWSKIADLELQVVQKNKEEEVPHYIELILEPVLPVLFENLTNDVQEEDKRFDSDNVNPSRQARNALVSFAQIVPEQIIQACDSFYQENIQSEDITHILAALISFETNLRIMSKNPNGDEEVEYAYSNLETILPFTGHENYAIREQTIFIISEIIGFFSVRDPEIPKQLFQQALEWLQSTPIDAAASCILIRRTMEKVEFTLEEYSAIKEALFNVLQRSDIISFSLLLENLRKAFFVLVRNLTKKTEFHPLLNDVCTDSVNRLAQLIPVEMEESQKQSLENILCDIIEEYAAIRPINGGSNFYSCVCEAIQNLFEISNPDTFMQGYYILGVLIASIRAPNDENIPVIQQFYSALLPIIIQLLQNDDDVTVLFAAKTLSVFYFCSVGCEEQARENAPAFLEILLTLIQNPDKTNQYYFPLIKACGVVIRASPRDFMEPAQILLNITKNMFKSGLQPEQYEDFILSSIQAYSAYIEAFEDPDVQQTIRPNITETCLLCPIKLGTLLEKRPAIIYQSIYSYIKVIAYSKASKLFNVVLRKPFVQFFFSDDVTSDLKIIGSDIISFRHNLASRIKRL